jgi:hypothetical protein
MEGTPLLSEVYFHLIWLFLWFFWHLFMFDCLWLFILIYIITCFFPYLSFFTCYLSYLYYSSSDSHLLECRLPNPPGGFGFFFIFFIFFNRISDSQTGRPFWRSDSQKLGEKKIRGCDVERTVRSQSSQRPLYLGVGTPKKRESFN